MPAKVTFTLDDLSTHIPRIFDQVQNTTANHQKNYVALHKLHAEAAKIKEPSENDTVKLRGERAFEDVFIGMLSRALPIKKGASVVDRIIKFVGGYTKFLNEKTIDERRQREAAKAAKPDEEEGDEPDDDSTAARFSARLLRFLLKGCEAKDKVIRFRVVQCIAEMVAHLGELDDKVYEALRDNLLERVRDKESVVRVQAAIALSKLCGTEDPDEEPKVTDVIIDVLAHDTAADVRRAALLNLPIDSHTLPAILSRTRDVDATVRKLVYHSVLEPNCTVEHDGGLGIGPTHPRVLSIDQREQIVRNGLGDREDVVKNATAKLVATWVEAVRLGGVKPEKADIEADVIAFINLFDLMENSTAEDALMSVFKTRADILDGLEFGDQYWDDMTPEKAFLARVFVDHCVATKDDRRLEAALPVVTALAFRIQTAYNQLVEEIEVEEQEMLLRGDIDDEEEAELRAKREEARLDQEFIIGEMLRMSVNLDYADEIGRRKMFQLVRDMLSQDVLPEGLVARCLDVLRTLSPNERDLIRVVVELIHTLRDPEEEPVSQSGITANDSSSSIADTPATVRTVRPAQKAADEMSPEERQRADEIDLRCLSLCIGMLERVNGTFEENSTLEGILGDLIIPSVKRREMLLRERGLVCLGLCCLIARRMAHNSLQLFVSQVVPSTPEPLKLRVLQVIFDILMVHDKDYLSAQSTALESSINFLLRALDSEESDKVQALICVGLSKLMLSGMISDDRVLRSLVMAYVSPGSVDNQELRQCLSYFFPVYCYSSAANQRRMQKQFMPLYEQLNKEYAACHFDEDMISPAQACLMIVDWTDPQKAVAATQQVPGLKADESVHVDLASDIIKALFNEDLDKDDKKALCQLLGKLHIPDDVDDDKIRTLNLLMITLRSRRPIRDSSTKNAFNKFQTLIGKKFEKQLADFDEGEYRQLEYFKGLFEFLDEISPDSDWDEEEVAVKKRGSKRRSVSVVSDSTVSSSAASDVEQTPRARQANGKSKAKRRRISESGDESETSVTQTAGTRTPPPEAPSRVLPRRSAAREALAKTSKNLTVPPVSESEEDELDEDDEDDEDDGEETPAPKRIHQQAPQKISAMRLPSHDESEASVAAATDDEDADEVDDLL
ncbi:condensin complex subunit 3 [Phanerochaete sordida]|uniref:Condensin complex subunit 3 n=1 Tax=Phanerochaete sordida TaxID=48140 RepID=A0A9P3FXR5_9APHY|nr:condensin complex subunit 3 [Phanerochaete sordida]